MAGVSEAFRDRDPADPGRPDGPGGSTGGLAAVGVAPASVSAIRAATTAAVWAAAWQAGAPADGVLDALGAVAHRAGIRAATPAVALRSGLAGPGQASGTDLDLLALLRRGGRPGLLLPVAGDLRGLPVGGDIVIPALDAGAVVTLSGLDIGLVPMHGQWRAFDCTAAHATIPPGEAARLLDDAIHEATRALVAADLAIGGAAGTAPRDAMAARIRAEAVDLPIGAAPVASELLARAITLDALLGAAAAHRTAAVTSAELATVHEALGPLAAAAREARRTAVDAAVTALSDGARPGRR